MSETTGFEARTIHRMLELNGGMEGSAGFERNETNPLETDLVIIDEMSMVDITLMNSLFKSNRTGNQTDPCRRYQPASKCRTGKRVKGHHPVGSI